MLQGAIPVEFGTVFPDGAYAAGVFDAVRDFDRSQGDRFVQQLDKATGVRAPGRSGGRPGGEVKEAAA